jgi:hypothetical protein
MELPEIKESAGNPYEKTYNPYLAVVTMVAVVVVTLCVWFL